MGHGSQKFSAKDAVRCKQRSIFLTVYEGIQSVLNLLCTAPVRAPAAAVHRCAALTAWICCLCITSLVADSRFTTPSYLSFLCALVGSCDVFESHNLFDKHVFSTHSRSRMSAHSAIMGWYALRTSVCILLHVTIPHSAPGRSPGLGFPLLAGACNCLCGAPFLGTRIISGCTDVITSVHLFVRMRSSALHTPTKVQLR